MAQPIPAFPAQFLGEPSQHRFEQIDKDRGRWREIAGPFFDAGGKSFAIIEKASPNRSDRRKVHHSFFLILKGELKFGLGREASSVTPETLLFIPAGTAFTRSQEKHAVWIEIELDDTPFWSALKSRGTFARKYESTGLVYLLACSIIHALRSQDIYSIRCAHENAGVLITLLKRELERAGGELTTAEADKLTDLVAQIQEHPEYSWDLPNMCRRVAMSQRGLYRAFARAFKMPPVKLVRSIRMEHAAGMLSSTERTVNDIAIAVGYRSPYSFSRLFKERFGVSPDQYRRLSQEERQAILAETPASIPADR